MIFLLFWEGAFIRRGAFIRGGAFILKSEILGGRLFEAGCLFEEIRYIEKLESNEIFAGVSIPEKIQNFDNFSDFCSPKFYSFMTNLAISRLKCNRPILNCINLT